MAVEDASRLLQGGAGGSGDQVLARHHLPDGPFHVLQEAEVPVGEDPNQAAAVVRDRDPRDVVALHDRQRLADGPVRPEGDRFDDHAGLGALDLVDLSGLLLHREVAVDDADAPLPRQRDREASFGHGIHGGGDDRDGEGDVGCDPGVGADIGREHLRPGRKEQHVVERQPQASELVGAHDAVPRWCGGRTGGEVRGSLVTRSRAVLTAILNALLVCDVVHRCPPEPEAIGFQPSAPDGRR